MPGNPHSTHIRSKFTPELLEVICAAIREGATAKRAYTAAGIAERTYYEWIESSEQIAQALTQARDDYLRRCEQKLQKFALEGADWRAVLEVLKRLDRDQWGDKLDLTGLPDHILLQLAGQRVPTPALDPSTPIAMLASRNKDIVVEE